MEKKNNNDVEIFPDSSEPAYSDDGVDLTLIRWMLSLTPTERLEVLQQNIDFIFELRNAKKIKTI